MINEAIPEIIYDPFFFFEKKINMESKELTTFNLEELFIHEIAYYLEHKTVKPWENPKEHIPELLNKWKSLQGEIKTLFEQRNKKMILSPMKQGIGLLLEFIFWTNGLPSQKLENVDMDTFKFKPVNFLERIQFLMKRPNIYPSFIQLIELFEEHEKQYSKFLAISNIKKS
jgi:hypothetical protein